MELKLKIRIRCFLLLAFLGLFVADLIGQSEKDKLQKQKKSIENEISFSNKLLEETKRSKKTSYVQLQILKRKIGKREALITTINAEIRELSKQIIKNQQTIQKLTEDLEILKAEYTEMIYQAYKNRSAYDRIMFIFAAENFNQAYQRLKYLQQYSIYRKKQVELIEKTQEELEDAIENIEKQKRRKIQLLKNKQDERNQLSAERSEKNNTIKILQDKEVDLAASIKKKETAAAELQRKIQLIIEREIRESRERANAVKSSSGGYALTPKELRLSETFTSNRGKLPWPIERAIVSSTFGRHKHPDFDNIWINNNGIDLLTNKGAKARAVFEGIVKTVTFVEFYNYVVIIQHGDYRTVYTNLADVFVKNGDEVITKQEIGIIYTDPEEVKTEFHFEVLKDTQKLNPLQWLAGKK